MEHSLADFAACEVTVSSATGIVKNANISIKFKN